MSRVIHFEINADQPERAVKFYADVFGWDIQSWGGPMPYWLITTGPDEEPGINGAIKERSENQTTVNTVSVDSIEESLEKIRSAGGKVLTEVMTIPGIGYNAYCQDSEGNMFGVIQNDAEAKA